MNGSGDLWAVCRDDACRHRWVVAQLPMALDRLARLTQRAACPKCGDIEPRLLPTMPRQPIDAATAAACPPAALAWIRGDDVGMSSKAIWSQMIRVGGEGTDFPDYPRDPDDLGRCLRLLEIVPEWKLRIGEMAAQGPVWTALVAAWDELTALMAEECGIDGSKSHTAPRTYARMRAIRDSVERGA